jgi:hypothetical protein
MRMLVETANCFTYLQLRMTDYNPLAHERGIYSKLMALANDSLSFR